MDQEFSLSSLPFVINLTMEQQQKLLSEIAIRYAEERAYQEILCRRYILAEEPTPGLLYDDRLPLRLGCGKTKAYELLQAGVLRHQRIGAKYIVTEDAVREFFADRRRVF
ncbi:helix-turn-helix domain-containing protein [Solirubrum puertoriconensis]|uniref:helix-turn-helix domain-containing protein n=1 Tax=Solirubrum puertoriconensis TaxID=1751427 RepID=UPI00122EA4D0|nr:helix-turn-helix domain-containing protein [Solirubrum puertoriconensis]